MANDKLNNMNVTSTRTGSAIDPLVEKIRGGIRTGVLTPGKMIGSEYDLARTGGISRGTVRRGIGNLIAEGLVERRPGKGIFVREQHVKTRSVCLMIANLAYSTWALLAQHIQEYGREKGVSISVFDIHVEIERDLDILAHLSLDEFQGAIITFLADKRILEAIYKMRLQKKPFVVIGGDMGDPDMMLVGNDNFADGYLIGERLIQLGHRRIGYIGVPDVIQRYHGLRHAMDKAGLPFDPKLVIDMGPLKIGADWFIPISKAVEQLLSQAYPPTAIFSNDDGVSALTIRILRQRGIAVPQDISVVGVGGEVFGRFLDPPLTTVALPLEKTAKIAVDMVIKRMINPNCEGEQKFIQGMWTEGESVGPLRQ